MNNKIEKALIESHEYGIRRGMGGYTSFEDVVSEHKSLGKGSREEILKELLDIFKKNGVNLS